MKMNLYTVLMLNKTIQIQYLGSNFSLRSIVIFWAKKASSAQLRIRMNENPKYQISLLFFEVKIKEVSNRG